MHRRGGQLIAQPPAAARGPLLTRAGIAGAVAAALCLVVANLWVWAFRGTLGLLNDFYIYWSAATLLNRGGNPYDVQALARVRDAAGLNGQVGEGFSYPVLFGHLLRPLALLPPQTAGVVFMALSVVAVGLAVALLLSAARELPVVTAVAFGLWFGLFPPIAYGLWVGQANDILLPFLALAYRGLAPGVWVLLAGAVKLFPISGLLAFPGRRDAVRQLVMGIMLVGVPALVLQLLLPAAGGGFGERIAHFLAPDAYWSNASINGAVSRLALSDGWPLAGLPVEVVELGVVALVTAAVGAVLVRCRFQPFDGALALAVWLGAVAAPKNSLWNFAPLLLCFAFAAPRSRQRPGLGLALLGGLLLMVGQLMFWAVTFVGDTVPDAAYRDPLIAWGASLGLAGALLIGAVTARIMLDLRSRVDRQS
jgi:hypothetical protein